MTRPGGPPGAAPRTGWDTAGACSPGRGRPGRRRSHVGSPDRADRRDPHAVPGQGRHPIQGAFRPDSHGTVELLPEYEEGLADIEGFSHLILLYHLHRGTEIHLTRAPFLADDEHGIFATRHPCRPNRIGMTVVRLLHRCGRVLSVAGIDVLDETPLIDVKPYVRRFDAFPEADEGWFSGRTDRPKPPGRE